MKTNLRIGEVLMERNYITQEQMEQALAYQKEHREKRVGQILIELGFVTETQVIEALAARLLLTAAVCCGLVRQTGNCQILCNRVILIYKLPFSHCIFYKEKQLRSMQK